MSPRNLNAKSVNFVFILRLSFLSVFSIPTLCHLMISIVQALLITSYHKSFYILVPLNLAAFNCGIIESALTCAGFVSSML